MCRPSGFGLLVALMRNPGYFDAEDAPDGAIGVDAVSAPGGLVPP
jgi:hypothetical protein